MGAMYIEGDWNLKVKLDEFPDLIGKWDVAVLPKCPSPASGDGRASISNGFCYATGAKGKNLEAAKDFLKFLGTEEANKIQGGSGAAIPAYIGTEDAFYSYFDKYDYKINILAYDEMFDYAVQSVNNASRPEWKSLVNDELLKVYGGSETLEQALANCQKIVDEASAK
jgi:multiple sugar transport system substrate-binding protein